MYEVASPAYFFSTKGNLTAYLTYVIKGAPATLGIPIMPMILYIKRLLKRIVKKEQIEAGPEQAYDLWADSYDKQPGNLMLDLDEELFPDLLKEIDLTNKKVADIGCGTGRHWEKLYSQKPLLLYGFDVSSGMLQQLQEKYPYAITQKITGNLHKDIPNSFFDVIICTLTIAHINNMEEAIAEWQRILKPGGDIILTDFHPTALANGGKRTFSYNNRSVSITNYVHTVDDVQKAGLNEGLEVMNYKQIKVSEKHKIYYEQKNALHVFNKFVHTPIIYGIHLKKINARN